MIVPVMVMPLLVSAGLAYLASYGIRRWYLHRHWVDDPTSQTHEKIVHTYPVPRGGGLAIALTLLVCVPVFLGIDKHTLGILFGIILLGLVGWWDDIKDINPYIRLGLGFLAAGIVVASGIGIAYITNPLGEGVIHLNMPQIPFYLWGKMRTIWIWSDILALIWIVWCMNMLNWSKGLDGQLPGIVVIAAVVIGLLSIRFVDDITQWPVIMLAGITAGVFLGFLPWNSYPQKMMPGYGGGSIAGYLLAVLSILSGAKLATLVLVLGIPMIDAIYVILRRIRNKRSPVWGDRSHFHHRLLDLGWSKRKIAWFYWCLTLFLGFTALQLNTRQKAFTILLLVFLFGALLLWVNYFISSSKRPDHDNG